MAGQMVDNVVDRWKYTEGGITKEVIHCNPGAGVTWDAGTHNGILHNIINARTAVMCISGAGNDTNSSANPITQTPGSRVINCRDVDATTGTSLVVIVSA